MTRNYISILLSLLSSLTLSLFRQLSLIQRQKPREKNNVIAYHYIHKVNLRRFEASNFKRKVLRVSDGMLTNIVPDRGRPVQVPAHQLPSKVLRRRPLDTYCVDIFCYLLKQSRNARGYAENIITRMSIKMHVNCFLV